MTDRPPANWRKAAAEYELSAVMWNALADSSLTQPRTDIGSVSADFNERISGLYREMARVAWSTAQTCREIDRAEACEEDCCGFTRGEADDAARDAASELAAS